MPSEGGVGEKESKDNESRLLNWNVKVDNNMKAQGYSPTIRPKRIQGHFTKNIREIHSKETD